MPYRLNVIIIGLSPFQTLEHEGDPFLVSWYVLVNHTVNQSYVILHTV